MEHGDPTTDDVAPLQLLGTVELRGPDGTTDLGGPRQRGVLALLALQAGRPVEVGTVLDEVWGEAAGPRSRRSLATLVSRLRRSVEPLGWAIGHRGGAYTLRTGNDATDLAVFRRLARADDRPDGGDEDALTRALQLWRGSPLAGLDAPFADRVRPELLKEKHRVEDRLAEHLLAADRPGRAVVLLEAMTAETPYDEHRWSLLIDALHRAGRVRDALTAYRTVATLLRDDLGVEPSPALRAAEMAVLCRAEQQPDPAADGPAPFVGRYAERVRLQQMLDAVTTERGGPRTMAVRGAAGIGTTALVQEALRSALPGTLVVHGTCAGGGATAGSAVLRPLGEVLGTARLETLGGAGADLRRLLHPGEPFDPEWLGLLEHRLTLAAEAAARALTEQAAVLLVVDDAEQADATTVRLLEALAADHGPHPLAVVRVERSPAPGTAPISEAHVLEVGPLDDDAVRELAGSLLGRQLERRDEVVRAAGGHPLVAIELARVLAAGGSPARTLTEALDLRTAHLSDTDLRVLRVAAVDGSTFDAGVVATAAGVANLDAAGALDESCDLGLVHRRPGSPEYIFGHELVRAHFANSFGPAARETVHGDLARSHEREGCPRAAARHALLAGSTLGDDEQVALLVAGGTAALDAGEVTTALEWLDAAEELAPGTGADRMAVAVGLGAALASCGRVQEGRDLLDRTRDEAAAAGRWDLVTDALVGISRLGLDQDAATVGAAGELAGRAAHALRATDPLRAGRADSLCVHLHVLVDPPRAERHLAELRQLALAEPGLRNVELVTGYRWEVEHGEDPEVAAAAGDGLRTALHAEHAELSAAMVDALELAARVRAGLPLPAEVLERLSDTADRLGRVDLAVAGALARSIEAVGSLPAARAERVVLDASDLAFASGTSSGSVAAFLHTFALRREQGRAADTRPVLDMIDAAYDHPGVAALRAVCQVEAGETDEALRSLAEATERLEADTPDWTAPALAGLVADLAATLGHLPAGAAASIRSQLEPRSGTALTFGPLGLYLGPVDLLLGRLDLLEGDRVSAERRGRAAAELSRRAGLPLWGARADLLVAATVASDDPTAARQLRTSARHTARRLKWDRLLAESAD